MRAVGDYCARWGYTPQKASRLAHERDDALVQRWLAVEFPKIRARAKCEGAELNWGDETGARSESVRPRGYAPKGRAPLIRIPARRSSVSLLAAVTNQGAVRFMVYRGPLTTRHVILAPDVLPPVGPERRRRGDSPDGDTGVTSMWSLTSARLR